MQPRYRQPNGVECICVLAGTLLPLPFELATCLAAELLARASFFVDGAAEALEAPKYPSHSDLVGVGPTAALWLVLRPLMPTFRRSLCEMSRKGDERWSTYDEHASYASKLVQGTDWLKLSKVLARGFVVFLRKVEWRRSLWSGGAVCVGLASALWLRLKALIGKQSVGERVEGKLAKIRRDCDVAKTMFQAGHFDAAASSYKAVLPKIFEVYALVAAEAPDSDAGGAKTPLLEPAARAEIVAELQTQRVRVLVNAGLCYKKLGRFREGADFAAHALDLEPEHTKALFLRGTSLLALAEYDPAIRDLSRVVILDPSGSGILAKTEIQRAEAARDAKVWSNGKEVPATTSDSKLSREKLLELLPEIARVQSVVQQEICALARRSATSKETLSFVEGHKRLSELDLPRDPLEDYGIDAFQLLAGYEDDEEVMNCAQDVLQPSGRGYPERAKSITIDKVVEVHKCMLRELTRVANEFKELPAEQRYAIKCKGCELTSELLVSIAVEEEFDVRCEDVEMASALHAEELQGNLDFAKCSEQLTEMMQELMTQAQPPSFDGAD